MATFRKIDLKCTRTTSYGRYKVTAMYRGYLVLAQTTDSEIYDWLDDDSNKEKHLRAKRAAYGLIVNAFKNSK